MIEHFGAESRGSAERRPGFVELFETASKPVVFVAVLVVAPGAVAALGSGNDGVGVI